MIAFYKVADEMPQPGAFINMISILYILTKVQTEGKPLHLKPP
jgi:hypothetical protein